ncbi:hypothetical protein ACIRU3_36905 [Streptomyces sp. NPDC101151]|uniref:hypothetical protein n=1 Tax=Streptomyces sp. NPDC101151 TaxID=3366115 RepID=UPI0038100877
MVEPLLWLTLLAQNAAGWARLCRLVSAAHAEAAFGVPAGGVDVLGEGNGFRALERWLM